MLHDADHTLQKITHDNSILRQTNQIQESTFDVELDEPLCPMRNDTKLVLIDIPGLNEAGSKDIYQKYVNDKWNTFDCVIAVMDVMQGVNTEEQVQLLHMIKRNLVTKKKMPVIVLCNKVDDPDNPEIKMLVNEVRNKVKEIFVSPNHAFAPAGTTAAPSPNGGFGFGAGKGAEVDNTGSGTTAPQSASLFSSRSTTHRMARCGRTDANSVAQSESSHVKKTNDESTFGGVGMLFKCILSTCLISFVAG
jgi:Elongation factor Tu GTP binding domain